MNRTTQLFKGEDLLQNNLHILVNRYTEDFSVPFHAHDFIEYCYVAEGRGFHHIESEIIPVHKGMLFAIPLGISHVFRPTTSDSSGDPLVVYNCLFDEHMVARLFVILQDQPIRDQLTALGSSPSSYFSIFDRDGSIENTILKLYQEISMLGIGSATMLQTLLCQLIVTVYRQKYGEADKPTSELTEFTQIVQYLEQNLHRTMTLIEVARISQWSSRHLQRLFLRYTGQAFGSYLQNLRVQKSCELLRSCGHKISMIADLVGYRDIDSFNAVFKKIVGQTPVEYRRLYKP